MEAIRRAGRPGDKGGGAGPAGFGRRNVTILDCSEILSHLSVGNAFL
ncbi:hypothetical protein E2C01_064555 [Portunus trituberculatus]|uniref:Uncharacterized protein n=1 Tax=Portunus trituberculatus TaxID=210409 RepID=A0A5B7HC51_PORTR|nr:hypothetical protein [Portunus trituberculatus]